MHQRKPLLPWLTRTRAEVSGVSEAQAIGVSGGVMDGSFGETLGVLPPSVRARITGKPEIFPRPGLPARHSEMLTSVGRGWCSVFQKLTHSLWRREHRPVHIIECHGLEIQNLSNVPTTAARFRLHNLLCGN